MSSITVIVLLLLVARLTSEKDPFSTLVAYENNQRLTAQIIGKQYHLLPFRISGLPQHFIQAPQTDELINVEVMVHWINNNSVLRTPEFDLTQKVRLVIQQQRIGAIPKRSVITKQFLTQTGFKLELQAGCSYRWRIQSSGKVGKLVKIAFAKRAKNISYITEESKEMYKDEVQTLREMKKTLQKAKQARSLRENKKKQAQIFDIWAWASGIEIASIMGFLLVQLTLFQKFLLPTSVV